MENHYAEGNGEGNKILNPVTEVYMKENSNMEMTSIQIKGVTSTERITKAVLDKNTNFVVTEKIMTAKDNFAKQHLKQN